MIIGIIAVKAVFDLGWFQVLVGAEQPVPNRKHCAIIAVGIRLLPMMVHFVHIGRNKDVAQWLVDPAGQANICVGKLGE